ncbi:MAG: hypothetical protein OXG62_17040 [Nitrospinae bacterium]|nr:hypothetical protein [Nitrospinota bacterium]
MTEFEMATLAVQRMDVLVAAVVGFSKCALIGGRANREEARKNRDEFLKSS